MVIVYVNKTNPNWLVCAFTRGVWNCFEDIEKVFRILDGKFIEIPIALFEGDNSYRPDCVIEDDDFEVMCKIWEQYKDTKSTTHE